MDTSDVGEMVEQFELEFDMFDAGRDAVRRALAVRRDAGRLAQGSQQLLLGAAFDGLLKGRGVELVSAIAEQLKPSKAGRRSVLCHELGALKAQSVAYCAVRVLLNEDFDQLSQQTAALRIGAALEFEARLARIRTTAPWLWAEIENIASPPRANGSASATFAKVKALLIEDEDTRPLPRRTQLQIGNKILQIMLAHTDLFELKFVFEETDKKQPKRINFIVLSTNAIEKLAAKEARLFRNAAPELQPMVAVPRSWSSLDDGGYYTLPLSAIKVPKKTKYGRACRSALAPALEKVLQPLNTLQRTPWRLNEDVHDVMQSEVVQSRLASLSKRTGAAPNASARKRAELEAAEISNGEEFSRIVELADIYRSRRQPFYFVWQLDFRGRAYPRGSFLQPQGRDAARALLRFHEQRPIGRDGERWLALHGANMLGLPSATSDERLQAFYRREAEVLAIASDPRGALDLWLHVTDRNKINKRAWRLLAFCFEWARFKQGGSRFESSLPVSMDGTCNAIQHFAAMLRDPELGRLTNLTPSRAPSDVYLEVARRTCVAIREDSARRGKVILEQLNLPLESLIDRDFCKEPVMTRPYGSTKYSLNAKIDASLSKNGEYMKAMSKLSRSKTEAAEMHRAVSSYVANKVYEQVNATLACANELMNWLKSCASALVEQGEPVTWIPPLGFPIMQAYPKFTTISVKTELSKLKQFKASTLKLLEPTDELCPREAVSGIAANFVHSHDATHMMLTALAAQRAGITSLRMVHDAFATHADNAGVLAKILREQFVRMYTERDVIADFDERCRGKVGERGRQDLLQMPARGTLDLSGVLESEYFFS